MIFVDSNVLIDVLEAAGVWTDWSRDRIADLRISQEMVVNHIVLAELAGHFSDEAKVQDLLSILGIDLLPLTIAGALRSGQAFRDYRRRGGERRAILADFLIAGHAAAIGATLLTRDRRKIAVYFPDLTLITPEIDSDD